MMLETKHFGKIEIADENVIHFQEGLPGFEKVKEYVVIHNEDQESPFHWLQSVDQPSLAFVIVNPFEIKKDYEIDLDDTMLKSIEVRNQKDMAVFSIVVVPDEMSKMSMNLKAPVIINPKAKKGMQVILDSDTYSVRHYILEEIQKQEVTSHVGTGKEKGASRHHK